MVHTSLRENKYITVVNKKVAQHQNKNSIAGNVFPIESKAGGSSKKNKKRGEDTS